MQMYEYPRDGDLKEIKIELTRDCVLSCVHCSSNAYEGNSLQLSMESVLSLIDQAKSFGIQSIVFSGGEPLLWPWLETIIERCRTANIRSSLYTTGIDRSSDTAKHILHLEKLGLRRVIFSLYSSNKQNHEEITRTIDSFSKTIATIQLIGESNLYRELHFVPLKRNFQQIPDIVEFAKSLKIQRISFLRFVPQGRGIALKKGHEMLGHKETLELRNVILSVKKNSGIDIRLGSPYNILFLNKDVDCIAARKTLSISPSGDIYPCDAFKNIDPEDIGLVDHFNNILSNTLKDCWERSSYLNAIRSYLSTPFSQLCVDCESLISCKSGCLAQKVLEQESIECGNIAKRPDPLCLHNIIGGRDASNQQRAEI